MAASPALRALAEACGDLMDRSAELPDAEQGLLEFLIEYRFAVHAFTAVVGKL
jgi:hypothetical protein